MFGKIGVMIRNSHKTRQILYGSGVFITYNTLAYNDAVDLLTIYRKNKINNLEHIITGRLISSDFEAVQCGLVINIVPFTIISLIWPLYWMICIPIKLSSIAILHLNPKDDKKR
jgi:hypothetical protein